MQAISGARTRYPSNRAAADRTATGLGQQRYVARAKTHYHLCCCCCKDLSFNIETYTVIVLGVLVQLI